MSSPTLCAIILAAGRGLRMSNEHPKAYINLNHKPILRHSIDKFLSYGSLNELILVVNHEDQNLLEREILSQLHIPDTISFVVVEGGAERQDSALAGVQHATAEWIFVHDAARPFFALHMLDQLLTAAQIFNAAIPTLPVTDSLRVVDADGRAAGDIARAGVHLVQTPQCYERALLLSALESASRHNKYFTDEAAAVLSERDVAAKSVEGNPANFKITTAWDLKVAELIALYPDLLG